MDVPLVWLILLLALTHVPNSESSHFRGGIMMWKSNPDSLYKVEFNFRLAFRRSSEYCDNTTVSSQGIIGSGTWYGVSQSHSYNISSAGYRCTEYSAQEDWSAGENSFNYTFPYAGPWVVKYATCCWIPLMIKGSPSWEVSTTVNLTRRADTGQINSSPISASSPIIRVQIGCSQNIRIPMEDPDGDVVRCRWAAGSSECGGICGGFPYASLEESSCTLQYDGNGVSGWYGVALMLEDFPRGTQDFINPLSKVGLQFLVQIANSSSGPCGRSPFFTGATPDDYACVDIAVGSYYSASLVAQHMDTSTEIVEISTVPVAGMSIGSLYTYYDRFGQKLYSRSVTWTPFSSASGKHIFCFKAVDKNGRESEQRCITLLVGSSKAICIEYC